MITVSSLSDQIGLSPTHAKDLLRKKYEINNPDNNWIKLSPEQSRYLCSDRGFYYRKTIGTIGAQKGGIGKSLLTCHVAVKKSFAGAKVLIIDLDPEACATSFFLTPEAHEEDFATILELFKMDDTNINDIILPTKYDFIDIVPCRGKARRAEKFVRDEHLGFLFSKHLKNLNKYDLILFEVTPTFSNIMAAAYLTSDIVIMPTFPDAWAIESVFLTQEDIEEEAEKWGVPKPKMYTLLNKYLKHRTSSQDALKYLMENVDNLLPFHIPDTASLQNSVNNGHTVFEQTTNIKKMVKDTISDLDFILPLEHKTEDAVLTQQLSKLRFKN